MIDIKRQFVLALKKLMQSTPLDKISVVDIALEAELSRQTFYMHFKDRYDLVIYIFEQSFKEVAAKNRTGETTWLESGVQHLSIYKKDLAFYQNALRSYDRNSLRAYLKERIYEEFYYKCTKKGLDPNDENALYALKIVVLATNEATFEWVENGCIEPEEVIVRRFDLLRPLILSPFLEDVDSEHP